MRKTLTITRGLGVRDGDLVLEYDDCRLGGLGYFPFTRRLVRLENLFDA